MLKPCAIACFSSRIRRTKDNQATGRRRQVPGSTTASTPRNLDVFTAEQGAWYDGDKHAKQALPQREVINNHRVGKTAAGDILCRFNNSHVYYE